MKPLTARGVLASALLGTEPPEMPVGQLVALAGLFGVSENSARVALSRMVAAGEAATSGDGRYRLTGSLLARHARQRRSRAAVRRPFDGHWILLLLPPDPSPPSMRAERRKTLQAARFAERREGVWLRPDNIDVVLDESIGAVDRLDARPEGDQRKLAAEIFDLDGWAAGAAWLLEQIKATRVESTDDLASGFVLSAAVLRHFGSDPLLPDELLAGSWPGGGLRQRYDRFDADYRRVLASFHRAPERPSARKGLS